MSGVRARIREVPIAHSANHGTAAEAGRLFVVSTPIGNLGDLSHRAVQVLRDVSLVLAEDTRHSRTLLAHYDIQARTQAYHEHNEARVTPTVVERMRAGDDVALVSDAGTPLLSDPGARLVAAAAAEGLQVVPIPGASALLAALVASALPAERFTYFGFPPRRGQARQAFMADIARLAHTAVVYEAPPRLADTLAELAAAAGDSRPAVVARELTKRFEEVHRGTLGELAGYYAAHPARGEIVIVVGGAADADAISTDEEALSERAARLRDEGLTPRDIARALVAEAGIPRNLAYRLAQGAQVEAAESRAGERVGEGS